MNNNEQIKINEKQPGGIRSEGSDGTDGLTKKRSGGAHSSAGSTPEGGGSGVEGPQNKRAKGTPPDGMYRMNVLYQTAAVHGQGLPQNDALAAEWYRKAADQNLPQAQRGVLTLCLAHLAKELRHGARMKPRLQQAGHGLAMRSDRHGL